MKIALINDTLYPYSKGGAQKRIWEVAKGLAKTNEVHLFSMKYWQGDDIITKDNVILHGVCKEQVLYVKGKRTIREAVVFAFALLADSDKEHYDIIDCTNFPFFPCFSAKLRAYLASTPLVITWLEVWGDYWYDYLGWKGFAGKVIERLTTKLPFAIIADGKHVEQDLIRLGVKPSKIISTIPDSVDLEFLQSVEPSKDKYDVIYAGRLLTHKNVDVLVRAMSVLPSLNCVIIGDGPEKHNLEKLKDELRVKNVKFLGFLEKDEEVYSYMKSAKVFVHPSTREGCGLITPEANACGLPVVAINHKMNSASYYITKGENGYLCNLFTFEIASCIRETLKELDYMRAKSIERASKYTWSNVVQETEKAYKEVMTRSVYSK